MTAMSTPLEVSVSAFALLVGMVLTRIGMGKLLERTLRAMSHAEYYQTSIRWLEPLLIGIVYLHPNMRELRRLTLHMRSTKHQREQACTWQPPALIVSTCLAVSTGRASGMVPIERYPLTDTGI